MTLTYLPLDAIISSFSSFGSTEVRHRTTDSLVTSVSLQPATCSRRGMRVGWEEHADTVAGSGWPRTAPFHTMMEVVVERRTAFAGI